VACEPPDVANNPKATLKLATFAAIWPLRQSDKALTTTFTVETSGLEPPTPCLQIRTSRTRTDADGQKSACQRPDWTGKDGPGWPGMFDQCSIVETDSQRTRAACAGHLGGGAAGRLSRSRQPGGLVSKLPLTASKYDRDARIFPRADGQRSSFPMIRVVRLEYVLSAMFSSAQSYPRGESGETRAGW
jgi:hypothetical protein